MRKFDAFTFVPGAICSLWASKAAKKEDAKEGGRKVEGRRGGAVRGGWDRHLQSVGNGGRKFRG